MTLLIYFLYSYLIKFLLKKMSFRTPLEANPTNALGAPVLDGATPAPHHSPPLQIAIPFTLTWH